MSRIKKYHILIQFLLVLLFSSISISQDSNNIIEDWSAEIIRTIPHDDSAFTQGLVVYNNYFYESTGQYGQSSIRKIEISSGKITKFMSLDRSFFAEGITVLNDNLFQLTWKSNKGFIYNPTTFEQISTFNYEGEGWGITNHNNELIISNGSSTISFYDSETYLKIREIKVKDYQGYVEGINELEYINNEIWANIWYRDKIARISPSTGYIIGWINLENLYPRSKRSPEDVLNGIAYNTATDQLFVTGKNWPFIFEIKIIK